MIKYKGQYHGFFAEWWGDCGVNSWTASSHVVHATSDTAAGPFTYRDVSLGREATNPHVMYDNRSDVFTIFHLGDATGGSCSGSGPFNNNGRCSGVHDRITCLELGCVCLELGCVLTPRRCAAGIDGHAWTPPWNEASTTA